MTATVSVASAKRYGAGGRRGCAVPRAAARRALGEPGRLGGGGAQSTGRRSRPATVESQSQSQSRPCRAVCGSSSTRISERELSCWPPSLSLSLTLYARAAVPAATFYSQSQQTSHRVARRATAAASRTVLDTAGCYCSTTCRGRMVGAAGMPL